MTPDERRGGYVRLWRYLWDSPIWTGSEALIRVALTCLKKANYKPGLLFDGTVVPRGSFVTSRENLAKESRVGPQAVRGAISTLAKLGFLTSETTSRFTRITLRNYEAEQSDEGVEQPAEQPARNQRATSQQPARNHNLRIQSVKKANPQKDRLDFSIASQKTAKTTETLDSGRGRKRNPPDSEIETLHEILELYWGASFPDDTKISQQILQLLPLNEAIELFQSKWRNKKYRPEGRRGPRGPGWFLAVAQNYAEEKRAQAEARSRPPVEHPPNACRHGLSDGECSQCLPKAIEDAMTNPLRLADEREACSDCHLLGVKSDGNHCHCLDGIHRKEIDESKGKWDRPAPTREEYAEYHAKMLRARKERGAA